MHQAAKKDAFNNITISLCYLHLRQYSVIESQDMCHVSMLSPDIQCFSFLGLGPVSTLVALSWLCLEFACLVMFRDCISVRHS